MWMFWRRALADLRADPSRRITPERVRERVARGASYLDDVDPGWAHRVDPQTLSLSSGRHCVLGQLHGEFRLGLGRSYLVSLSSAPRPSLSPVAYGFKCVDDVPSGWQDRDYALLTEGWRAEVRARQMSDGARDGDNRGAASRDRGREEPDRVPSLRSRQPERDML